MTINYRGLLGSIVIQSIGTITTIGLTFVVARKLGAVGQGFWAAFKSMVDFIAVLIAYGLPLAATHLINNLNISDKNLVKFSIKYSLIMLPVVACCVYVSSSIGLVKQLSSAPDLEIIMLTLSSVALAAYSIIRGIILGSCTAKVFNIVTFLLPAITLLVLMLWPLADIGGLMGVISTSALITLGGAAGCWWLGRNKKHDLAGGTLSFRLLVGFGGWNFMATLAVSFLPILLIQWMSFTGYSIAEVGVFSITLLIQGAVLTPANMVGPLLYKEWALVNKDLFHNSYVNILRVSLFLSVVLTIIAFIFLDQVLAFMLGSDFIDAVLPAKILLMTVPIGYGLRVILNAMLAIGEVKYYVYALFWKTIFLALFLFVFSPASLIKVVMLLAASEVICLLHLVLSGKKAMGWTMAQMIGMQKIGRQSGS